MTTPTPTASVAVELPAPSRIGGQRRTWHCDVAADNHASVTSDPGGAIHVAVLYDDALTADQAEHLGRALLAAAADARTRTEGGT